MYSELYCSGVLNNRCIIYNTNTSIGECYWNRKTNIFKDEWDSSGMEYYNVKSSYNCLKAKHILFAGDSTVRDLFYEFVTMANFSLFTKPDWKQFQPTMPFSSMGRDSKGMCFVDNKKEKACCRSVANKDYSIHFHFLAEADAEYQINESLMFNTSFTHMFIQCPIYKWFYPHVYNKEENRTVKFKHVQKLNYTKMATSCYKYVSILEKNNPNSKLFLLGITPLPGWTKMEEPFIELKYMKHINHQFGIHCKQVNTSQGIRYKIHSYKKIVPIDRYVIVGKRRRDMIHPYFNAQFAISQFVLNSLC
jgi:hypothetical protein